MGIFLSSAATPLRTSGSVSGIELSTWAGRAALGYGYVSIAAILALVLFYAGVRIFGTINDFLTLVATLPLLALVLIFHRLVGRRNPLVSVVATSFGLIGGAAIVADMALFLARVIPLMAQVVVFILSFGPLGVWIFAVSSLGRAQGILPSRLAWFGVVIGVGELIASVSFLLFGGLRLLDTTDFRGLLSNYPLLIGTVPGGIVSYLGTPIWALWLGRVLVSSE